MGPGSAVRSLTQRCTRVRDHEGRLFPRDEIKILPARQRAVGERLLLALVAFQTSSRTMSNSLRTSTFGSLMSRASAVANGLLAASPSSAVSPCLAAYTTMNPASGSMLERPLLTSFTRHRALHLLLERIVAAGIEQHEPQLARAADRRDHLLQRHRLRFGIVVGGELGVGRNQIIDAADLHAVAGIIDHGPIRLLGLAAEMAQRGEELVAGEDRAPTSRRESRGCGRCRPSASHRAAGCRASRHCCSCHCRRSARPCAAGRPGADAAACRQAGHRSVDWLRSDGSAATSAASRSLATRRASVVSKSSTSFSAAPADR